MLRKNGVAEKAQNSAVSEFAKDVSAKPSTMVDVEKRIEQKKAEAEKANVSLKKNVRAQTRPR